jgi:hypothetical protein
MHTARHFMATTRVMPQDGALCQHSGLSCSLRPRAVGGKQDKRKISNRRRSETCVHNADFSPERIVALPGDDETDVASVMAPLARNLETLTSSKSS